jgi:hypothetical protein
LVLEDSDFGHGVIVESLEELVLAVNAVAFLVLLAMFQSFHRTGVFIKVGVVVGVVVGVIFVVLTSDFLKKVLLASLEELVVVNVVNVLSSALVEVVHVELTDKGSQVVVLEVHGKNLLAEVGGLFDDQGSAFWVPVDDVRVLALIEDVVGLADERGD